MPEEGYFKSWVRWRFDVFWLIFFIRGKEKNILITLGAGKQYMIAESQYMKKIIKTDVCRESPTYKNQYKPNTLLIMDKILNI